MKDTINERLKLLATAQESMSKVTDIMEQWENSQIVLEKSTFDSINVSDRALNLSREGNKLVSKLQECCRRISNQPDMSDVEAMDILLGDTGELFHKILEAAKAANEIAHFLEQELEGQREIQGHMKNSIGTINKSLDQTVACAEFLLAEL